MANWYPYITAGFGIAPFLYGAWLHKTKPSLEKTARAGSVLVAMNFILLFAAMDHHTRASAAALVVSMMLTLWFKGSRLNQIRGIEIQAHERFFASARTLLGFLALYGIYFFVVQTVGSRFTSLVGVPVALIVLIYASPIIVRIMWKARPIQDAANADLIRSVFQKAGVDLHHFYYIDVPKLKFHNAMVTGPKWGFGPFSRTLFITKSLFDLLTPDEVQAVLYHEAAHFKLNHVRKRMGASFAAFLFFMIFVVIVGSGNQLLFSRAPSLGFILFTSFILQIPFVKFISRKHEFEADLEAVRLGARGESLISALNRLTSLSGIPAGYTADRLSKTMSFSVHPTIAERAQAIRRGFMLSVDRRIPFQKYAAICTTIALLQFGYSYLTDNPKFLTQKRSIASIQIEP